MKKYTSLQDIQADLASGEITCRALTEYYLKNIKEQEKLNVFLEVYEEEALAKAEEVDKKIKEGIAGKLAGMVIGLKDVLCHKDHGLQSASKILDKFVSQFTGTAVQRILDEDVIVIGRQNCDEFAMGSSNEKSAFGPTLNAADNSKVPGGSSGASAVAVQAELCLASLGSDTGGSVRQPASFCGVIGLKPTYSRISRYGLTAYASSFDTIGVLSHSTHDAAILLEIMAGADDFDSTVSQKPVPSYSKELSFDKKVKIAYLSEGVESEGVQVEVKERTQTIIDSLKSEGHEVEAVSFDYLKYSLPAYYILTCAEASANLSRFDGVRYGYRSENTIDLMSMYKKSRSEGFGTEVKKRIMLGTFVLSAGYYDAYYTKAQKVRRLIKEEVDKILSQYDFIILPTAPTTAFTLGEHEGDTLSMYLADLFTVPLSLAGVPAVSIPNGEDKKGMPIGLQIASKSFNEGEILGFSQYLLDL
ncbi:MAG: Asp-tRNA(Asn)/Glu-tRNA(Gln) amidotransferase subunit GatA [Cytophagales bacterium]|nr:Asp-tRNA(Asn)/Glu-tRNA(Gln) amidotransferase subunit GatA [Cytophagales bacterium]